MFKYASANFYTGRSGTVVVVGVQRLFVAMLGLAWLFGCVAKRNRQCANSVGSIATKSMTVKNGGNTLDAMEGLALWFSHCISRACGLAGGSIFSLIQKCFQRNCRYAQAFCFNLQTVIRSKHYGVFTFVS